MRRHRADLPSRAGRHLGAHRDGRCRSAGRSPHRSDSSPGVCPRRRRDQPPGGVHPPRDDPCPAAGQSRTPGRSGPGSLRSRSPRREAPSSGRRTAPAGRSGQDDLRHRHRSADRIRPQPDPRPVRAGHCRTSEPRDRADRRGTGCRRRRRDGSGVRQRDVHSPADHHDQRHSHHASHHAHPHQRPTRAGRREPSRRRRRPGRDDRHPIPCCRHWNGAATPGGQCVRYARRRSADHPGPAATRVALRFGPRRRTRRHLSRSCPPAATRADSSRTKSRSGCRLRTIRTLQAARQPNLRSLRRAREAPSGLKGRPVIRRRWTALRHAPDQRPYPSPHPPRAATADGPARPGPDGWDRPDARRLPHRSRGGSPPHDHS